MDGISILPRENGCSFQVQVVPRAGQDKIMGFQEGCIRVKIAAPPVDGAANQKCIEFFARLFRLPKSRIQLIAGAHRRKKTIVVEGKAAVEVRTILQKNVERQASVKRYGV